MKNNQQQCVTKPKKYKQTFPQKFSPCFPDHSQTLEQGFTGQVL